MTEKCTHVPSRGALVTKPHDLWVLSFIDPLLDMLGLDALFTILLFSVERIMFA